jgi:transmembrane sensor
MTGDKTDSPLDHAVRAWTRKHSGTWSEGDETELRAWLGASPEHRAAYDKVARVWTNAGDLAGSYRLRAPPHRRFDARRILVTSCAAVLVAAVVGPLWRAGHNWWSGVPVRWTAARGEPRTLSLQDGTRVQLDADSELVVQLGARVRRVSLMRGEALFTVVHAASRPFEADVGAGRITDLGTRFDVETVNGATRIAVLEGRVGVVTPHGEMSLEAGRGGGYDRDGVLSAIKQVDDSVALWQQGQRRFDAELLTDVVERLQRYHAVTFEFADPHLQRLRLSGTFRMNDLEVFLRTLATALPVEARWINPHHIELRAKRGPSDRVSRDP